MSSQSNPPDQAVGRIARMIGSGPDDFPGSELSRIVFAIVREECGSAHLTQVVETIAEWDHEMDSADEGAVDRLACRLHHVELPKLSDSGVIEYDPRSHTITVDDVTAGNGPVGETVKWMPGNERLSGLENSPRLSAVIRCLHHHRNVTLADLAEFVVASEGDSVVDRSREDVLEEYLSLYHSLVPRMEEAGLVRYSQGTDRVKATRLLTHETVSGDRL